MTAKCMVVALAAMLAACGCDETPTEVKAGGDEPVYTAVELSPDPKAPVADFPVPMGFSLNEGKSRSFAAGGSRSIFHVYRGRANKFDVARFYRKQMPVSRWVLVTDRFLCGEVKMDFEKETEKCQVMIRDGNFFKPTEIHVELFTSGRIRVPAQDK